MNKTASISCRCPTVLAAALCAAATLFPLDALAAPAAVNGGSESLGSELLEDLDPSLFGPPVVGPSSSQPAEVPPGSLKRILPGLPDDLLGEDVGQPRGGGPLENVRQRMQTAETLIRQPAALDRAGQVQQQVVAELDALIEQLSKKCQGACQSDDGQKPASQRSQAAGAKPAGQPGRGTAPARDSTTRLGRGDSQAAKLAEREALVKELWGHLPPQAREQMLQIYTEEFLPQYELEIEKYFRRLAEEPNQPRPD